jgi:hypothetical protein
MCGWKKFESLAAIALVRSPAARARSFLGVAAQRYAKDQGVEPSR